MKNTVFTLLLCLIALVSYSITYYVSTSGNDANTGKSTSAPWKTITKVNSTNFNGDTILFLGGSTFYGSLYFTNLDFGTSVKPIVIGSYGTGRAKISSDTSFGIYIYNAAGFQIKNLIFTGVNRLSNKKAGISIYMDKAYTFLSYLKIDNVEVYGYREAGISIGSWATKAGYKDITITNCSVHDNGAAGISTFALEPYIHRNVSLRYNKTYNNAGKPDVTTKQTGSGIVLGNVDIALVEYCTSYNNGFDNKYIGGGPVGIWAYASDSVTFQYNESHNNKTGTVKDGGGFDFDGGCTNSIMQYNYSHDNYGAGYLLANYAYAPLMKNITIRYNISENDGRRGDQGSIHLWASAYSAGIQAVNIYNNTVFVKPISITGATSRGLFIRDGSMSSINVRNNIIQSTGGVPLVHVPYNTTSCLFQGNNYWPSGGTFKIIWGSTTYSSLTAWRTATNQEKINGNISGLQVDPKFADTTMGVTFNDATKLTTLKRYKLFSTSGLINKGLNLKTLFNINVGSRDYWANSLVNKTTFHIGAFEGTPITPTTTVTLNEITERVDDNSGSQDLPLKEHILLVSSLPAQNKLVINYALARQGRASITMFNLQGQLVKQILTGDVGPGEQKQLIVNTDKLTNGIYLISMRIDGEIITRKIFWNR